MICVPCRKAADQQQPRNHHCPSTPGPGAQCTCQHRTERYRTAGGEQQPT